MKKREFSGRVEVVRHFIVCDCGMPEHQAVLEYYPDDDDDYPPEVYLRVHLNQEDGLLKRIKAALKYVFGYTSRYGNWSEIVISISEAWAIFSFIHQFLEENASYD